ncbi:uncharacterized protein LOC143222894 [Tachypleus tridentatus]|uniref:uncharacterized protein LOC143222894 n=1 Tax=Tachypleus tridentatus TaxID=6853 RepID=UPI003FD5A635
MKKWLYAILLFAFTGYTVANLVNIKDCGGIIRFNCSSLQNCPVQFNLERCNNPNRCVLERQTKYNINVRFQWGDDRSRTYRMKRVMTGVISSMFGNIDVDYETVKACISPEDSRNSCRRQVTFRPGSWYTSVDKFNVPGIGYAGMELGAKYQLVTKDSGGNRITLLCAFLKLKLA